MKYIVAIGLIVQLSSTSLAQDTNLSILLNQIDSAANYQKQGSFTYNEFWFRTASGEDSMKLNTTIQSYYKLLPIDTLLGFQLASKRNDGYHTIYDGQEYFELVPWNKTLTVANTKTDAAKIRSLKNDYFIFPLFKYLNNSLQRKYPDSVKRRLEITDTLVFHNEECYVILMTFPPDKSTGRRVLSYFYISRTSLLPIGYKSRFETPAGKTEEIEEFNFWLTNLNFETQDGHYFLKDAIKGYDKERPYQKDKEFEEPNKLLRLGTDAPKWELYDLNDKKLSLSELRGRIIVIDFWYKSCAPCLKQMISLQKLHEKYTANEIYIVGVNMFDDPIKDKMKQFLEARNVTFTTVYRGKSIAETYGVSAAPALYIIDKSGLIIYTHSGYSETVVDDVSKIIDGNSK